MEEGGRLAWAGNHETVRQEAMSIEAGHGGEGAVCEVGFISWVMGALGGSCQRREVVRSAVEAAVWRLVQDGGQGGQF